MPELATWALLIMLLMWTASVMLEVAQDTESHQAETLWSQDAAEAQLIWPTGLAHASLIQYVSAKALVHCTARVEASHDDILYTMELTSGCKWGDHTLNRCGFSMGQTTSSCTRRLA